MKQLVLIVTAALAISCSGTAQSPTSPTSSAGGLQIGPPQTYDSHPEPPADPEPGSDPAPPSPVPEPVPTEPMPDPAPETPTDPAPAPATVTGRWVGVAPDGIVLESGPGACDLEFDLQLDLTSNGTGLTGTATTTLRKSVPVPVNCEPVGTVETWPPLTNGTVGPGTISFSLPGGGGVTVNFSGTFTATRMTGTVTSGRRGTFALNRR